MNHSSHTAHYIKLTYTILLTLVLVACGETATDPDPTPPQPVVPPSTPVGNLQLTVEGLPNNANASVLVAGPEDYSATVTGSQTLQGLRTGSYTLEAETIEYRDATYSGTVGETGQATTTVDITEDDTTSVEVTYTSVGSVEEGEIAPGTVKEGLVAENAFDDYSFRGTANVPLTFDFTGTGEENRGYYSVAVFAADNLDEALYSGPRLGAFGAPLLGFSPSEDGTYVLRIRGELDVVDYRVRAQYLSGTPEERRIPTTLEYGDTATGAVTFGSSDDYRFTGITNEPVLLRFSHDEEDNRYRGNYQVEFYRVGETEPLETSSTYYSFGTPPEIDFTPQEDGDYLIRVVGTGSLGTSLVRYSLTLERLE